MSGGSGTQTTTQSNAPPPEYMAAYQDVLGKAQNVAATPYQQYQGQLVAPFNATQQQGFQAVQNAQGAAQPYINQASQYFQNANTDLKTGMQPYINQAQGAYNQVANTNLQGALSPYQQQAAQGFGAGAQAVNPQQYSGQALQQYMSPYTQNVVHATQAQFSNQNQQQQNQLRGNAASAGALGSDRVGVAQAVLAGQQQAQEAPVIAGLYNQGFGQAQQEFNTQQATNLSAGQANRAAQMQGAQGMAGLAGQSLTAAQQQAALQGQAAQGYAGLGQAELGAGQAQGWLAAQSGAGMAGLGNQALSTQLEGANALLGSGATQQQQAQTELNVPYQQWLARQSYPFQTTSWLSNIAQGLGSGAGGSSSTTSPTAGLASQALGAGAGAAGLLGASGAFGKNGWMTGSGSGSGSSYDTFGSDAGSGWDSATPSTDMSGWGGGSSMDTFAGDAAQWARGGRIGGFARGGPTRGFAAGGVPDVSGGVLGGSAPGAQNVVVSGVPDVSATGVPAGSVSPGGGYMTRDWGRTTTAPVAPHDSIFGTILKTAGTIAASVYGGPAGGAAAGALSSQVHFDRGGHVPRGFAAGGSAELPYTDDPLAEARAATPARTERTIVPLTNAPAHAGMGIPRPPPAAKADAPDFKNLFSEINLGDWLTKPDGSDGKWRGGGIRGFAAGGDTGDDLPAPPPDYDAKALDASRFLPPPDASPVATEPATPDSAGPSIPPAAAHRALVGDLPPPAADTAATAAPPAAATRPVHPRVRGNPAAVAAAASTAPPVQPPPPHADYGQPGGQNTDAFDRLMQRMEHNRAATEDRANPWLSLATAGFGMAASNSPHLLQNLGAGAMAGIKQYVSSDQAAKQLASKVDENMAQLANAQAYHQAIIGTRERGQDMSYQAREDARQNAVAVAMIRAASAAARAGSEHATTGDLMSGAIHSLIGTTNPDTGKPYTAMEAFRVANGAADRLTLGQGRNDTAGHRVDLMADHYAWQQQNGDASLELRRQHYDDLRAKGYTDQELRYMGITRDMMGKPTVTPEQAHSTVSGMNTRNAPGAGGGGSRLPSALPESKAALVPGMIYATPKGNATWDGAQFQPVQ